MQLYFIHPYSFVLQIHIHTFNQSRYPRINKESLMPIARSCNTSSDLEAWYPPGHGNNIFLNRNEASTS